MNISKILYLFKKEDGATAIEYGLIAALVAVVIIVALNFVGGEMTNMYSELATTIGEAGN